MFYGTYRHAVDTKGRVAIPAQFRRDLADAVVAPGSEARLVIRPSQEWQDYVSRFQLTAGTTPEERSYMRRLYAGARQLDLDSQGRMLLSPEHRVFAQVTDRAVFVGLSNVVEIVGEELWDAESAEFSPSSFTELGDRVSRAAFSS